MLKVDSKQEKITVWLIMLKVADCSLYKKKSPAIVRPLSSLDHKPTEKLQRKEELW